MMRNKARIVKLFWLFGLALLLVAGPALPAFADEYRKGDLVIVDVLGDGSEVHNGVIQEIYTFASGTSYSIRWDEGGSQKTGSVPASRLRPRGGARQGPGTQPPPNPEPLPNGGTSSVSDADVEWFLGKWNLTKWGGGFTAQGDVLSISPGRYTWTDANGRVLNGAWRKLTPQEDNVTGGKNGIVLLSALQGQSYQVGFRGVNGGKDLIDLKSNLGSFDGERVGASKGQPVWNQLQFTPGDAVIVTMPDGEQCNGIIENSNKDHTGTVFYYVNYTNGYGKRTSGNFQAIRIRRR